MSTTEHLAPIALVDRPALPALLALAEELGTRDLVADAATGAAAAELARRSATHPTVDHWSRFVADPAVPDVVRTRALGHLAVVASRHARPAPTGAHRLHTAA